MSEGRFVIAIGTVSPEPSRGTILGLIPTSGNLFIFPGNVIYEMGYRCTDSMSHFCLNYRFLVIVCLPVVY